MEKTYFFMTNERGDYACFRFTDYEMYKKCFIEYKELGLIEYGDELADL
jgi:hypothetical protein